MRCICKLLVAVLALVFCLTIASCVFSPPESNEEGSTTESSLEVTTPEETTPEETTTETTVETPTATPEPDFSNTPDPDGTKRY